MSSEGQCHDATCCWKGLDLSNNVCEYEVNQLINEKVIRGNKTLMQVTPIYKPKKYIKKRAKKYISYGECKMVSFTSLFNGTSLSPHNVIFGRKGLYLLLYIIITLIEPYCIHWNFTPDISIDDNKDSLLTSFLLKFPWNHSSNIGVIFWLAWPLLPSSPLAPFSLWPLGTEALNGSTKGESNIEKYTYLW